jgi:hypothetical protein
MELCVCCILFAGNGPACFHLMCATHMKISTLAVKRTSHFNKRTLFSAWALAKMCFYLSRELARESETVTKK